MQISIACKFSLYANFYCMQIFIACKFRFHAICVFRRTSDTQNTSKRTAAAVVARFKENRNRIQTTSPKVYLKQIKKTDRGEHHTLWQFVHSLSIFERFKIIFTNYIENSVQFTIICDEMGTLFQTCHMKHSFWWNNLAIRHWIKHSQHLSKRNIETIDSVFFKHFYFISTDFFFSNQVLWSLWSVWYRIEQYTDVFNIENVSRQLVEK